MPTAIRIWEVTPDGSLNSIPNTQISLEEQLETWLDLQLDIATSPAHATIEMISEIRSESPALRREIQRLHQAPNTIMQAVLTRLMAGKEFDIALFADLVSGLAQSASLHAMQNGNAAVVKPKLRAAVRKLLDQD